MNKYPKDEKLYLEIKAGNERTLQNLYQQYRAEFRAYMMHQYKCNPDEALEIYTESFTSFYFNIKRNQFQSPLKCKLKTYLFSIGKYAYFNKKKAANKIELVSEFPELEVVSSGVTRLEATDNARLVAGILNTLGAACQELLKLIYFKNYSFEAAAIALNIPTQEAARKRKYDCLKKIRNNLKRKPSY